MKVGETFLMLHSSSDVIQYCSSFVFTDITYTSNQRLSLTPQKTKRMYIIYASGQPPFCFLRIRDQIVGLKYVILVHTYLSTYHHHRRHCVAPEGFLQQPTCLLVRLVACVVVVVWHGGSRLLCNIRQRADQCDRRGSNNNQQKQPLQYYQQRCLE